MRTGKIESHSAIARPRIPAAPAKPTATAPVGAAPASEVEDLESEPEVPVALGPLVAVESPVFCAPVACASVW